MQDQFLVSTHMTEVKTGEATTGSVLFPLSLYAEDGDGEDDGALMTKTAVTGGARKANIAANFAELLNERLGSPSSTRKTATWPRPSARVMYLTMYTPS